MRLSDAGLRRRPTKLIYLNHRSPPCLTEDATLRSLEPIVRPHPYDTSKAETAFVFQPTKVRKRT
jgi:hypothetical protein